MTKQANQHYPLVTDDRDIQAPDVQNLSSREAVASFLASLGYRVDGRVTQTPQALGITAELLQRQIRHVERLADHENGTLQVYLVELVSVTVANIQGLARAFRNRAGNYLLILTSDYEDLDFVLLERTLPTQLDKGIATRQTGIRPRVLSVHRRNPGPINLRALRRFTYTESDADYQFDKLRSAYSVAEWSEPYFNNRALFSDYYLNERLKDLPEWKEDPKPAYKRLRELYALVRERFSGGKEEFTRKELLEPVFEALGFALEKGKASTSAASESDYRLYSNAGGKRLLAVSLTYTWNRSLDGKDESRDLETPEENPGAAVVSILEGGEAAWAIVTNGKLWRLYSAKAHSRATNYYEIDLEETLASADPSDAFRFFWLLFRAAALVPAPARIDGRSVEACFLDRVAAESEAFAKRLGDRLKDNVFEEIFPHFAAGFVESLGGTKTLLELSDEERQKTLNQTFEATLTFLYRLLFLLYAEARELLPVREVRGYSEISLQRVKRETAEVAGRIADEAPAKIKKAYRTDATDLYDRIFELCRAVDQGRKDLNVPVYNGGLFLTIVNSHDQSPEAANARFLAARKIPDRFLALGLDLMARAVDEKRGDLAFIDYKSLGVRQLGSIYEGLLEFKLRVATEKMAVVKGKKTEEIILYSEVKKKKLKVLTKGRGEDAEERTYSRGDLYLENDRRERKATGSYYTPDYIVKFIVDQAVGPVLEEKFELLRPKLRDAERALHKEREKAKALQKSLGKRDVPEREAYLKHRSVVDELFKIRVLDPAMGSGHFLVEAVDFITDQMLRFLNAFRWNPVLHELEETRRTILEAMEEQGIYIDQAKLTDVNLLKRQVLKRCVYGVDLNAMAVELAKVSLWLDCFTLGAPLSFLDHHLRCGNSLVGATVEEAKRKIEGESQLDIFGSRFAGLMLATNLMRHVGELSDVTAMQVRESREEYRKASDALAPFKRTLDVYTSQWFGNGDEQAGRKRKGREQDTPALALLKSEEAAPFLNATDTDFLVKALAKLSPSYRIVAERALAAARENHFFHWELEFPEVFYGPRTGTTQVIERLEGAGFDAVVGNPPYDVMEKERGGEEEPHEELLSYLKNYLKYAPSLGGKVNLYRPFMVLGMSLLRPSGNYGQIIPMSFMGDISLSRTRRFLLTDNSLLSLVAFPQKDDENRRVFREAKLSTCIPILKKVVPAFESTLSVRTYPGNSFEDRPVECKLSLEAIRLIDPEAMPIPSCSQAELELAVKLHNTSVRLRDVAQISRGEINQTILRKFITTNASDKPLLKGVEIRMFGFNEKLSQGRKEYFDEAAYERGNAPKRPPKYRIAAQRITGVDEDRRLVCSVSSNGAYFADSTNSIVSPEERTLSLLVGILNSDVLNWRFSLTSTNNNVGTNELDALPYPREIDRSSVEKISDLVRKITHERFATTREVVQSPLFRELNRAVYSLFGLTSEEVALVEGQGRPQTERLHS